MVRNPKVRTVESWVRVSHIRKYLNTSTCPLSAMGTRHLKVLHASNTETKLYFYRNGTHPSKDRNRTQYFISGRNDASTELRALRGEWSSGEEFLSSLHCTGSFLLLYGLAFIDYHFYGVVKVCLGFTLCSVFLSWKFISSVVFNKIMR